MSEVSRTTAPELDSILGKKFPVLDDGFVRVVDYMGTDASIVQAARVSYGAGTKKVHEDRGLIRYLMRHRHTTPSEMCEIKLHVRTPIHVFRQWIRHRTASVNEYSTRYSEAINSMQKTEFEEWRSQSSSNKQGSGGIVDSVEGKELSRRENAFLHDARKVYDMRLEAGVAREQARKDLPLSTYTEVYWKIDLHNLFHFLSLRMDSHAQQEIRDYANVIGNEIVAKWVPLAWEAFRDYRMNALYLSGLDVQIVERVSLGDFEGAVGAASSFGWLERRKDGTLKRNRERQELEDKLARLNLPVPWGEEKGGESDG